MRGLQLGLACFFALLILAPGLSAAAQSPQAPNPPQAAEREAQTLSAPGWVFALVEGDGARVVNGGLERLDGASPATADTVFQIASLTKPFTAIVILRLAEQGRLGLDDRAARWLDWLPARYSEVTLRQLLTHSSGVPRDLRRENVDEFSIAEFQARFIAAEPSFAPGERWEYSNTGYILLSLIAERASRRSFGALLEAFIFRPVGMRHSRYRAPLDSGPGRALGYDWVEGRWQAAPPVYSGYGNSGIESTAADLGRFATALQRRRLLRPSSYAAMLAPATLASGAPVSFPFRSVQSSYGFGWFLIDYCGTRVASHGGTIAGFSSNLSWVPARPLTMLALANGKAGSDRIGLADKIAGAALRSALDCPG